MNKKLGIVIDDDFSSKHIPPFPKPSFNSFENPLRLKCVIEYFNKKKIFHDDRVIKLEPKSINEDILRLGHSQYHIESVNRLSKMGGGLIDEEVFITGDTYELAKKAVGGVIQAIESVLEKQVNQTFAIIRPPGHHAYRERASGLCIFNNIATAILYLRNRLNYKKKIAIIDIDNHFGDGLAQYFYEDPTILYFSIHEYDFSQADLGFIDELGHGEGIGKNINFPVPEGIIDEDFYIFFDLMDIVLNEFKPDLIIVAAGFDMYFADPIGNCLLTSKSYYKFAEKILQISEKICEGRIVFALEGGYSLIGLPYCIHTIIKALLKDKYELADFEKENLFKKSKREEIFKIGKALKTLLSNYWENVNPE
ncbi:MAG: histone deacetylase [Candidatus Hodarchaeota archaeon]